MKMVNMNKRITCNQSASAALLFTNTTRLLKVNPEMSQRKKNKNFSTTANSRASADIKTSTSSKIGITVTHSNVMQTHVKAFQFIISILAKWYCS